MKKPIFSFVFAAALIAATPLHAAAPEAPPNFSSAIEDLPLMPGFTAVEGDDVLFTEKGAGRIAESSASGTAAPEEVYAFYRRTLPQLGWKPENARSYAREGEKLAIDAKRDGSETMVRFSVKPNSENR